MPQTQSHVLVLSGGTSSEREVSLRSGAAVAQGLQDAGYLVEIIDPASRPDDFNDKISAADVIFPVLHGAGGEDGRLQAELDKLGARYVGSGATASELCFNKWQYKELLRRHTIQTATGALVDQQSFTESKLIQKPYVLKPADGGSSVDTFIIRDVAEYDQAALLEALERYPQMLLEELIEGTEITVGVLQTTALAIVEIVPPADGEFDYENKYNGRTQEFCPPRQIDPSIQAEAQALALKIHELCGCRELSRTDMIVTKDGQLYVLETNTMPGMTEQSLFPKAAAAAGYSMAELVDTLVQTAKVIDN